MDFFEAQARAKKRSARLVFLFGLAVLGTILASYVAVVLILGQVEQRSGSGGTAWVQPQLFAAVSLGTIAIVGIASLVKWGQFSAGGSAVAESVNGRRVDPRTTDLHERRLLNVVEEMAIASGTPVPAVYVLDDEPGINAFAAGLTTSDAVVAVTRGTLEKLTRDELQGVVAHEFSHILNGDMRLNVRLTALIFGILVLGLAGRGILWSLRRTRIRSGRGKNGGGALAVFVLIGLALFVIGYIGYFFGRLIQAAVSRQREFLADASAVQFTRNPAGISGALKKIGGYALGSSLNSAKGEAIGHFFFAQGFRSLLGGLWATHPPLDERLRAIDPRFDGEMFRPPEVVDVARESFQAAGFGPGNRASPEEIARQVFAAKPRLPSVPPSRIPFQPAAALAAAGSLTAEQLANAHVLLEATPLRLRDAAHASEEAPALVYGLLLDPSPAVRHRQRDIVRQRSGDAACQLLGEIEPALEALHPGQRLPLLQLTLPALRQLPLASLDAFVDTLDELVHADATVSAFEFALQKLLVHTLALGRQPGAATVQYHSFHAVADEISVVLSALAHHAVRDPARAAQAFATGAGHLKLVEAKLGFREAAACDFARLDSALDKLAAASLPIKQRTLIAAAHVVGADGQVLITEAELLRAIAAALDVPMPPLA